MDQSAVEQLELQLLLEALFQRHGCDFRSYAQATIERAVRGFLPSCGLTEISGLIPMVLHDEALCSRLLEALTVTDTEMFRDPFVYRALREHVMPVLKTWPHVKIWHAGCSTGEEVYSTAIVLAEERLYGRTTIYATDFDDSALARAREGIYESDKMRDFTIAYQEAGGTGSLSDYYRALYGAAVIAPELKTNVTFAEHNLTTDGALGEMHLIVCRNVLIYFDQGLQNRVLAVFAESLIHGGFLCIGAKEDMRSSPAAAAFEEVDRKARIYKRVIRS
ncbi:MAG: protein-glutamate O-methyltransferase CheR [Deltaproteobacteria bacterium]